MRPRLALASLLGVLACLAAPALAGAAPQVKVIDRHDNAFFFDLGEHAGNEDVDARYTVRSSPSEATAQKVVGFSLRKVLAEAADERGNGFDDTYYDHVKIQRPGAGSVGLSQAQVETSGAFPDGRPVVWAEQDGGIGFLRPSSGSHDANAGDVFVEPSGTLVVREGRGSLVRFTIEHAPRKPRPKQPVTFTVDLQSSGSGQSLSFRWAVDGRTLTGAEITHAFRRPGCYLVGASALEHGDEVGSAAVRVKVGSDCEGGPNRAGGGKDGKRNGASDGAHDAGANGSSSSSGGGGGSAQGPATAPAQDPGPGARPERRRRAPASPGQRIEGELLDDVAGRPASAQDPQAEPEPQARAVRSGSLGAEGGAGLPGAALGILITGGLLGLGALRELERGPLARTRKPWS